jgi:hypothetical protein
MCEASSLFTNRFPEEACGQIDNVRNSTIMRDPPIDPTVGTSGTPTVPVRQTNRNTDLKCRGQAPWIVRGNIDML